MIRKFCVAGPALWLAACAVGPNYHRPALDVPAKFRGAPEAAQGAAFAELDWWAVLEDPVLQSLIKDALANNYNLRIAANHVLQAREQLGITRANQLPALSGFVEAERQRAPPVLSDQTIYSGGLQLSWVLDFWGQYRRATEAARATLLATEYAQSAVRVTLIANVASAYFQLRAFDQELDASTRILGTNRETLRITTLSVSGGARPITDQMPTTPLAAQAQAP